MLVLKNISFSADSDGKNAEIIRDLTLTVGDNRFVVITGPNGGGKSTLAKIIAGIVTPTSGQMLLNGEDITSKSITERARMGVGFAFQQPVRFKGLTVHDLMRIAAGKDITAADACEYLSEVGLCAKDYIDREVNASLSGGELKRIEIATVLARDVKLALFDEPEAGIDLWSFNNLIRVFEEIRDSRKCSLVIISHQERILSIADEIIMIQNGKLGLSGTRDSIFPRLLCKNECADRGVCVMEG
jgi:Fe-S cluster assembly ATP-binding protein